MTSQVKHRIAVACIGVSAIIVLLMVLEVIREDFSSCWILPLILLTIALPLSPKVAYKGTLAINIAVFAAHAAWKFGFTGYISEPDGSLTLLLMPLVAASANIHKKEKKTPEE